MIHWDWIITVVSAIPLVVAVGVLMLTAMSTLALSTIEWANDPMRQ